MKSKVFYAILLALLPLSPLAGLGITEQEKASLSGNAGSLTRVISTGKGFTLALNTLYMFPEAKESLVVVAKTSQSGGHFTEYLDPRFPEKALILMDASPEEIVSHKPDWVVLKSYLTTSLGAQLESLGVKVLYVDLETPEQYTRDLEAIGKMFGNPSRAEELINYFQEKRQNIIDRTREIPDTEKPKAAFIYYTAKGGSSSFNVPPAEWMQTLIFEWAGAVPVWKGIPLSKGWTEVGFEQLAAWDPELIFLVSYHMPVEEAKKALLSDPKWQGLKAVKTGNLLAFPGDYLSWDQPDPRWILGLYWLTGKLHPSLVSQEEVTREVKEFFHFAWNLPYDAVDRDIITRIKGDYP